MKTIVPLNIGALFHFLFGDISSILLGLFPNNIVVVCGWRKENPVAAHRFSLVTNYLKGSELCSHWVAICHKMDPHPLMY